MRLTHLYSQRRSRGCKLWGRPTGRGLPDCRGTRQHTPRCRRLRCLGVSLLGAPGCRWCTRSHGARCSRWLRARMDGVGQHAAQRQVHVLLCMDGLVVNDACMRDTIYCTLYTFVVHAWYACIHACMHDDVCNQCTDHKYHLILTYTVIGIPAIQPHSITNARGPWEIKSGCLLYYLY